MLYREFEIQSRSSLDRGTFFGSVSVSKDTFMGVAGGKDTFSYTSNTFDVSTDLETGSLSVSKDTFMGIEHNLDANVILFKDTAKCSDIVTNHNEYYLYFYLKYSSNDFNF